MEPNSMASMIPALNEHIRKLARREAGAGQTIARKAVAQLRREMASLQRLVKGLSRHLSSLQKGSKHKSAADSEMDGLPPGSRFRADGLRTHRAKLGLSAKAYGQLIGVSGLTVYHWESGKSKPRRAQLAKIIAIRGLGRREAERRLAGSGKNQAARKTSKRSVKKKAAPPAPDSN